MFSAIFWIKKKNSQTNETKSKLLSKQKKQLLSYANFWTIILEKISRGSPLVHEGCIYLA